MPPPCRKWTSQVWTIHRSAWKVNSRNFVVTEFSEVHIQHRRQLVLGSHLRLATSAADGPLHSRRPHKERTDLCERSRAARLAISIPYSPHQIGVPGHYVRHNTYSGLMICNSSLAKRSESSAPLQGPPSRSTRGGFGFFRWLETHGHDPTD